MSELPLGGESENGRRPGFQRLGCRCGREHVHGLPTDRCVTYGESGVWSHRGEHLVKLEARGAGVAVALEGPGGFRTRALML